MKKISDECSAIDHRSFTIANIPFLAQFARLSRGGENVSYILRYLYLFTISIIHTHTKLFSQNQIPPFLKTTMLGLSRLQTDYIQMGEKINLKQS